MGPGEKLARCLFANRPCDRVVGRSTDTVFIAAPSADEYHFDTDAAKGVVTEASLKPLVAVHTHLFSQEVFCEKICTPVIECRFCIVFLNGANPNVLYEYGLMRPLRKRVISLLREDEECPFNVDHLDRLLYRRAELTGALTAAVEAAAAATRSRVSAPRRRRARRAVPPYVGRVAKLLELRGVAAGGGAFADYADNTTFSVRQGPEAVYFVASGEAEWDVDDTLADTVLVCRRLDTRYRTLRRALKVREKKAWGKSAEEDRAAVQAIEHVHFVYATPEAVDAAGKAEIEMAISDMGITFPLPAVTIWSPTDVDALLKEITHGGDRAS